MPDFYAKEAIGAEPACITPNIDKQLKDLFAELNFCKSIKDRNYRMDDNNDPLIKDC